jgi:hypothetical protein
MTLDDQEFWRKEEELARRRMKPAARLRAFLHDLYRATPWGRDAKWRWAIMELGRLHNLEISRLRADVDELQRLARVAEAGRKIPSLSELNWPPKT